MDLIYCYKKSGSFELEIHISSFQRPMTISFHFVNISNVTAELHFLISVFFFHFPLFVYPFNPIALRIEFWPF